MPPQRRPLGTIDRNRVRGPETNPYTRGKIVGLYTAGLTQRQIVDLMDRSRDSVRGAIALEILNINSCSLPRLGRPKLYDNRDQRMMLKNLRLYPKLTFQQRRDDTGLEMSNTTIKNIAKAQGLCY